MSEKWTCLFYEDDFRISGDKKIRYGGNGKMRILMLDLDTLRPDHLHCYGYERETSPVIDSICEDGMRFENYHCSDAPCLPSRAALLTGRFGIHNGAVNHGGMAADLRLRGIDRDFQNQDLTNGLFYLFRKANFYTASVSTFAERHSSYWFQSGFHEIMNCGKCGGEMVDDVLPTALDWLERKGESDNWFLHINLWDAHTPYRTPLEYGNPFENDPMPAWLTEDVVKEHLKHVGPHGLNEIGMYTDDFARNFPRQLGKATNLKEVKQIVDGYDCGIRYMDEKIGEIIRFLKEKNLYEDMAIIVTSDHGENIGEFGIYSEHGTADEITTRVPMIIKWPGMKKGVEKGFHYNIDLCPTIAELLGQPIYEKWDGQSYAETLKTGEETGHPYLVVSQCSHVCQRAVRFDDYIYIRTYHDGFHLFPVEQLYDLKNDYHEQHNLAEEKPELCAKACRYLVDWEQEMMKKGDSDVDPLWTVMKEGGPYHAKGNLAKYYERLKQTGREEGAEKLKEMYPEEFKK